VIRVTKGFAGGNGFGRGDLHYVEGLGFREIEGDAFQLHPQDLGGFSGLVRIGSHEKGLHVTESTTRTSFMIESPACAR
jgi:hypothetical protein